MCCGAKRAVARGSVVSGGASMRPGMQMAQPAQVAPSVTFEYTGETRLTVISPTTGARYHFDAPGAQVSVDPRDRGMMVYVPDLRPVRFTRSG